MSLQGRHFLNTQDFTTAELEGMLDLGLRFKREGHGPLLAGKILTMLFFNPSLRTRVSFEVAMAQLGGTAVCLNAGGDTWKIEYRDGTVMDGENQEQIKDAARVLGRYGNALAVRAFPAGKDWALDRTDPVVNGFARDAGVPVINMESSLYHPCQAMADVMTMKELWGRLSGRRLLVTWAWHPRALPMAVPNAIVLLASRFGMDMVIARPEGFGLAPEVMEQVRANTRVSGGHVTETDDLDRSFEGAHAVYAKAWGSMAHYGRPDEEKRAKEGLRRWIVDEPRMGRTDKGIFLHCLPIRRNVEATDGVLDGNSNEAYREAENRLHVQKAILASVLGAGV